ncbi:energy-coupling factor ABC transporter ATP-binding protein [uncultured Lactobacillus sp.]|uniref:energy-coupling factor ABC transporter ATP-binding protein n=1 Tax=uncultured Lactobacillus sp. TaxID=153152 RepID=UPI00262455B7|nr:energy-coupling factor ABC transporter ATP-binding protein [uncultured Lactobacillus sp.]
MTKQIIEVENLSYKYKDATDLALKNISFKVQENQWLSIIGHNGSGKSTLSRLLNGLLVPEENPDTKIVIDGLELNSENLWKIRDKIGIVFQNPDNQFVGTNVQDDVAFGLENRNVPRSEMIKRVDAALSAVGMQSYKNAEPQMLSGGQKQRVAIAGIIAIEPKIIILDESTSMLDPEGRNSILKLIRKLQQQKGMTVISITHNIEETLHSDDILVLDSGKKVAQGKPEKIFSNMEMIKKAGLGLPFIYELKQELSKNGVEIPSDVSTEEKMVEYLCQLNSKM